LVEDTSLVASRAGGQDDAIACTQHRRLFNMPLADKVAIGGLVLASRSPASIRI
jgi:hypothetical protein